MQTINTLYERHTSLMSMRSKAALYVQYNTDNLEIGTKNISYLYFILNVVSFIRFYKHKTTLCCYIIWKSMQPKCLDRNTTDRNVCVPQWQLRGNRNKYGNQMLLWVHVRFEFQTSGHWLDIFTRYRDLKNLETTL